MENLLKILLGTILVLIFTGCVQEEHLKKVTFRLDMRAVQNVGKLGLKGEFTNPQWEQIIPLLDTNGDHIYEATVSHETAQNTVEFKFVLNGIYELKDQENRVLRFKYEPEDLLYDAVFDKKD